MGSKELANAATREDKEILRKHFGKQWKRVLTPDVAFVSGTVTGGEEDFGDLTGLNVTDDTILIEMGKKRLGEVQDAEGDSMEPELEQDLLFSELGAFPEDTLADLKGKISHALGIPTYRQHLFWECGFCATEPPAVTSYIVRPAVEIDMRNFGRDEVMTLADIPVDKSMAQSEHHIVSLDEFRSLGRKGMPIMRVFVVDLEDIVGPKRESLERVLQDDLQFDIIYKGFVEKYWPALSAQAFQVYMTDAGEMDLEFPRLGTPPLDNLLLQQKLLGAAHERSAILQKQASAPRMLAVTSTSALVDKHWSRGEVNVRNAFDMLDCSVEMPAMALLMGRMEDRRTLRAIKKHVSAQDPMYADIQNIDSLLMRRAASGRTGDKQSQLMLVLRTDAEQRRGRSDLMTILILDDGSYRITKNWAEDSRLTFKSVIKRLDSMVADLIKRINDMGDAVFPKGGSLAMPSDDCKISLEDLKISTFWGQSMTSEGFLRLKERMRELEHAGIITSKGLQQLDQLAVSYQKGIISYNPLAIDRGEILPSHNTYAHLTDDAIGQRWVSTYSGRSVRIKHRITDIKVEIQAANEPEFWRIWLVVLGAFDSLVAGPRKLNAGLLKRGKDTGSTLKLLLDTDPELYDLKKHDADAKVYSVLCQSPRAPSVFNSKEVAEMSKRERDKLVKYWNFTRDEEAYYKCPLKKYSHLGFLMGKHPHGYCIPCCQKTKIVPGSKRAQQQAECMESNSAGDAPEGRVRAHFLTFGKVIPTGRQGHLPPVMRDGLFFGSDVPMLLGVPQNSKNRQNIGFLFSLERISGDKQLLETFAMHVRRMGQRALVLARGSARIFRNALELADAISTFHDQFSMLAPGGCGYDIWEELFTNLMSEVFNLRIIRFVYDDGALTCHAFPQHEKTSRPTLVCVFEHRRGREAGGASATTKIMPIAVGSPDKFALPSEVAANVNRMLLRAQGGRGSSMKLTPQRVMSLIKNGKLEASIETELVNRHGFTYGFMLRMKSDSSHVYVPVHLTMNSPFDGDNVVGPRPNVPLPLRQLKKVMKVLGIVPEKSILHGGKIIGFISEGLPFYHDVEKSGAPTFGKLPEVHLNLDPLAVDELICASSPKKDDGLLAIDKYRLFVAEFASLLREERNTKMRERVISAKKFDFVSDEADRLELERALEASTRCKKGSFEDWVARAQFNFDRVTISHLEAMSDGDRTKEVEKIMRGLLVVDNAHAGATVKGANMFRSCKSDPTQKHCPLELSADELKKYSSVLAAEVVNPLKKELIPLYASGVINELDFRTDRDAVYVAVVR